jgi:hypothetical protein
MITHASPVDLVQGDFLTSFAEGSIGSGDAALELTRMLGNAGTNGTSGTSQWDHFQRTLPSPPGGTQNSPPLRVDGERAQYPVVTHCSSSKERVAGCS